MKKVLILLLGLASCSKTTPGYIGTRFETVWINQSDHTIRIIATGIYDSDDWDFAIAPTEQHLCDFREERIFPPEWRRYKRIDVYFDDEIHVPYARDASGELRPPADYERFSLSLCLRSRYVLTTRKLEHEAFYVNTHTYTFTNADYEAAREWAEKQ